MLVKELIAELQKLDQDAPVYGWNLEFSAPMTLFRVSIQPAVRSYFNDTFTYPAGYVIK